MWLTNKLLQDVQITRFPSNQKFGSLKSFRKSNSKNNWEKFNNFTGQLDFFSLVGQTLYASSIGGLWSVIFFLKSEFHTVLQLFDASRNCPHCEPKAAKQQLFCNRFGFKKGMKVSFAAFQTTISKWCSSYHYFPHWPIDQKSLSHHQKSIYSR